MKFILLVSKQPDVWKRARLRYIYRIYTEDKNLPKIERILDEHFPGYSVFKGRGVWKGVKENSLLIEVDGAHSAEVSKVAGKIKKLNAQDAILVQRNPISAILV